MQALWVYNLAFTLQNYPQERSRSQHESFLWSNKPIDGSRKKDSRRVPQSFTQSSAKLKRIFLIFCVTQRFICEPLDYAGRLIRVLPEGKTELLLNTKSRQITLADFEYIPEKNLVVIPTFTDNRVMLYKFTK